MPDFLQKQYHLSTTEIALPDALVYTMAAVGSIFGGSGGVIIVIVLLIIAALAYFFLKNGGAEKMAAMTPQGRMAMATGAVSAPPAVAVAGT